MSDASKDTSGVGFPPPLLYAGGFAVGYGAHRLVQIRLWPTPTTLESVLGWGLLVAGGVRAARAACRVEQFRDSLALEAGDSAHTVANYLRDVRRLAAYAGTKGARRPEDVTSGLLREFVYELKDLGLAPATIRRQISAVRTYYRYLVGEGHATRDPSERLESPRQWRRLPTVLSVAEIERLLAAPNADEPLAIRDGAF